MRAPPRRWPHSSAAAGSDPNEDVRSEAERSEAADDEEREEQPESEAVPGGLSGERGVGQRDQGRGQASPAAQARPSPSPSPSPMNAQNKVGPRITATARTGGAGTSCVATRALRDGKQTTAQNRLNAPSRPARAKPAAPRGRRAGAGQGARRGESGHNQVPRPASGPVPRRRALGPAPDRAPAAWRLPGRVFQGERQTPGPAPPATLTVGDSYTVMVVT